jgi:hypothetical protein
MAQKKRMADYEETAFFAVTVPLFFALKVLDFLHWDKLRKSLKKELCYLESVYKFSPLEKNRPEVSGQPTFSVSCYLEPVFLDCYRNSA